MDDGDDDDDDDSNSTIVYPKPHFQSNLSSLLVSRLFVQDRDCPGMSCIRYNQLWALFLSPADLHITTVELRV